MATVTIAQVSIATDSITVASIDGVNSAPASGTCATLDGTRGLRRADGGYAPPRTRGLDAAQPASTVVLCAVATSACAVSSVTDGPPSLPAALLARLASLGGSNLTAPGAAAGPTLGSFIAAAAGASGVSSAGISSSIAAGQATASTAASAPPTSLPRTAAAAGGTGAGGGGVSIAVIAGAAGGGVLLCAVLVVVAVCCFIRRRKQRRAADRAAAGPGPHKHDNIIEGTNPTHRALGVASQRNEKPGSFAHKKPMQRVKHTFSQARPSLVGDSAPGAAEASSSGLVMHDSPLMMQRTQFGHKEQGDVARGAGRAGGEANMAGSSGLDAALTASNPMRPLATAPLGTQTSTVRKILPAMRAGHLDAALSLSNPLQQNQLALQQHGQHGRRLVGPSR